ncbi:MAG: hypothetical protein HY279_11220 [Nitrospinae bacterium]|nr:hypothetical protein [Nitrospinota bacterium]
MRKGVAVKKIEEEIGRLTSHEQLKLVERIIHQLKKGRGITEKELDWSKLYGLGKGLWKGEDAQEYINRAREYRI